jgi:hypothetical protein
MEAACSSLTRRLTFTGLQGVISQKSELSITTGVTTSNPTELTTACFLVYSARREMIVDRIVINDEL